MDYKDMLAETLKLQAEGQFEPHRYEGREAKRKTGRKAKGLSKRRIQATTDIKVLMSSGSTARVSGKTGRNEFGRKAEEERQRRQLLRKLKTTQLSPIIGSDGVDALIARGLRNIWAVANAEQSKINAAEMHRDGLDRLRRYFIMNRIPVKWQVP